jgi:capsular exopolysaccharide synthesis family protein
MAVDAEPFRALLASVLAAGKRDRVIVVASPGAASGKTSILCNLGATLAEIDRKVLLIDGDLRKPELHKVFGLSNDFGLTSLVRDQEGSTDAYPMADLLQETAIHNLFVLPSGPGVPSISNLLYSPALKSTLERLRREFDMILIDTAPMLQFTDARVLARLGDGVILVFRSNRTTREMGSVALQRLLDDGISVLGTVLNDWDSKGTGHLSYGNNYPGRYQHAGGSSNGNGSGS